MKVELEKTFPVPGSTDSAWALLQDVESVAACMPGARITERLGDGRYKGTVSVRVGPATMAFRGELEVRDVDAAARSLRLLGRGTDSTGSSGASMDLLARIEPAADRSSSLVGKCDVTMSGKAAAFGGRMMTSVADQVLKQFAQNFAAHAAARSSAVAVPVAIEGAVVARSEQEATAPAAKSQPQAGAPAAVDSASVKTAPPAARELNGLALACVALKDWLRGILSRKTA